MRVLGIDPGKEGGLVVLSGLHIVDLRPMPTLPSGKGAQRVYDVPGLVTAIRDARPALVVIERQQAMPPMRGRQQGAASTFATGQGFGLLEGIVAALELRYEMVPPKQWQGKILVPGDGDTKARAALTCRRIWPGMVWHASARSSTDHEGIIDAALLAEWGRRYILGGVSDA